MVHRAVIWAWYRTFQLLFEHYYSMWLHTQAQKIRCYEPLSRTVQRIGQLVALIMYGIFCLSTTQS